MNDPDLDFKPQAQSWRSSHTRPGRKGNPNWIKNSSVSRPLDRETAVVRLRRPHEKQKLFVESDAKRIVIRAGRRGGKTVGVGTRAVKDFLLGKRVLYGAPTREQIDAFWFEIKRALKEPIDAGVMRKHEVDHVIEIEGTKQRIRAKTVWNADTLRGDYADTLILDEWQLMNEDAWSVVGAPMMLDNDGTAIFCYTPPSMRTRSVSKANDPRHAAKLYRKAMNDESDRWLAVHFTSHDNPHISIAALSEISEDMTQLAIRQEIDAEDIEDAPGAQWNRRLIEMHRIDALQVALVRIVVAVDPPAESKAKGSGAGIFVAGIDRNGFGYALEDASIDHASPAEWGRKAVECYHRWEADRVVAEVNNGGEMCSEVIAAIDDSVSYKAVRASRGKLLRAEPIAAKTEQGRVLFVGEFPKLEDNMCMWEQGDDSPHNLDAFVWAFTDLFGQKQRAKISVGSIKR